MRTFFYYLPGRFQDLDGHRLLADDPLQLLDLSLELPEHNGGNYRSKDFSAACTTAALKHHRTRPYRPRTNGKAERFIQTLLREWAYKRPYSTSYQRTRRLESFLHYYNTARPHAALNRKPPASRLPAAENNLMRNDS